MEAWANQQKLWGTGAHEAARGLSVSLLLRKVLGELLGHTKS